MTRYRNKSYLDEINDELTDDDHVINEAPELEVKNAEDESWKKRYGDLRRKHQSDTAILENRLKALETQLNDAVHSQVKLPKSEAEVANWVKQYPDVADIVKTLIHLETKDKQAEIVKVRQEFDESKHELAKQNAYNELLKLHPDFNEIRASSEFHEWVETQHKTVVDSLYENDLDYLWASSSIDKYKLEQKSKQKAAPAPSRDDNRRQAATAVRTPRTPEPINPNAGEWSESRVEALSRKEYDRYENEIDVAIRSGKFIYDLSAGAR